MALSLIKIAGNYKMPIIKINMQEIKTIYMYAMALNACDCAIKLFIISHYKLTHTQTHTETNVHIVSHVYIIYFGLFS